MGKNKSRQIPIDKAAIVYNRGEEVTQKVPREIFKLEITTDNPLLEGFAFQESPDEQPSLLGRESFDDDITPGFGSSSTNRLWKRDGLGAF